MSLTLQVNTLGAITVTHAFLPEMMKKRRGHIVTLASAASFLQCPTALDYSVSKAGALAFHEGLRLELDLFYKECDIHTRCVRPFSSPPLSFAPF